MQVLRIPQYKASLTGSRAADQQGQYCVARSAGDCVERLMHNKNKLYQKTNQQIEANHVFS
jgi:hypothetical protein